MGLDSVELVLRCEEFFSVQLADDELSRIVTVRELYTLLCAKLGLTPEPHPVTPAELPIITHKERAFLIGSRQTPLSPPPELLPWTPANVWAALVTIFVDQMSLDPEEILPEARIVRDLGID